MEAVPSKTCFLQLTGGDFVGGADGVEVVIQSFGDCTIIIYCSLYSQPIRFDIFVHQRLLDRMGKYRETRVTIEPSLT